MKLTRIEHRSSTDRVRLYLDDDDRPRLEISADHLLRAGLATGDEISEARVEEMEQEDQLYRSREAALSLLAHRARSRAELRRRLRRKEFDEHVIDDALAWLDERGYVDDAAFAAAFVRDRLRLRPRGRRALASELRRKGVTDAVAESAIDAVMAAEEVTDRGLARDAADAWARKNRSALRMASRSKEDRLKVRRRLYGHLARRGFGGDAVRLAMDAVLGDAAPDRPAAGD